MRRIALCAALIAPLVIQLPRAATQDALARVVASVEAGDLRIALEAAEGEPDPVRRAQAVLYVRHQAGDLTGALRAGLRGLAAEQADLWLLERTAYLALSLRETLTSKELVERLARAVDSAHLIAGENQRWREIVARFQTEVHALAASAESRSRAAARSRAVTCSILAVAAGALALLGLGRPKVAAKKANGSIKAWAR